jgi:hypothetical protein
LDLSFRGFDHGCLAPLLLGLWQGTASQWEHVVEAAAHFLVARKARGPAGVPISLQGHASNLMSFH